MSAPVLHLLAFSEPVVNSGEVSFRANFGSASLSIAGTPELMCRLGRALLGTPDKPTLRETSRGIAKRRGPKLTAERQRAYFEILAIAEGNPKYGAIGEACRARGINENAFTNWRKRRAAITS